MCLAFQTGGGGGECIYSAFINCQLHVSVDSACLGVTAVWEAPQSADIDTGPDPLPDSQPDPRQAAVEHRGEKSWALSQRRTPTLGLQPRLKASRFFLFVFKTMPPDAPFSWGAGVFVSLLFICLFVSDEAPSLALAPPSLVARATSAAAHSALIVSIQLGIITSGRMITKFIRLLRGTMEAAGGLFISLPPILSDRVDGN